MGTPGVTIFPASLDDADALVRATNDAASTLASNYTAGSGSLVLASAALFPASGIVSIGANILYYTGKSGNTLTGVVGGQEGTTDISVVGAATVELRITARHHTVLADAILALQQKIGVAPAFYHHVQAVPSAAWTIPHNMGFYPNVTVQDSAGRTIIGDVTYPDLNNVLVSFSAAFSGNAFAS